MVEIVNYKNSKKSVRSNAALVTDTFILPRTKPTDVKEAVKNAIDDGYLYKSFETTLAEFLVKLYYLVKF